MKLTSFVALAVALLAGSLLSGCRPSSISSEGGCTTSADCESGVCDRFVGECLLPDDMPEGPGDLCGGTLACPAGTECVSRGTESVCMELCETPGEVCASGVQCVATSEGPNICYLNGSMVEGCTNSVQCNDGKLCVRDSGGDGVCVEPCSDDGSLCEGGEVCTATSAGSVCLTGGSTPRGGTCESPVDCSTGNICIGGGEQNFCIGACNDVSDCSPGQQCLELGSNPGSVCRPELGASCGADADCGAGQACTNAFSDVIDWVNLYPDGYCTVRGCTEGSCPEGSECRQPGDRDPICAATCETDVDCRFQQGWECLDASACEDDTCRGYFGEGKFCMRRDRLGNFAP